MRSFFSFFSPEQANSELGIMLKSFELCGKTYNLPKSEFVDICELWKITDSYLFVKYPRTIELARDSRGFLAAMNAVHNHDVDDILPNCNAEISANGIYSNESRLLRAQMRCFDSKESRKDLNESMHDLIEIAQNVEIEESFRSEAELYMCRLHFELREYKLGNQKYEKLMKKQEFTRPTEFIRFWMGFDNCATAEEAYVKYGLDQFRCCYARLNTFSVAKFYIILYEYSSQQTDFSVFIKDLLDFYKTYPEIRTLKLIIVSYIQKKNYKDAYAFIRMKYSHDGKFIPFECGDEIPGTIEYLYGMIETEPDNLFNYTALVNIYCEQNNDLLKAVECLNRAIKEMVYFKLFKKCFKLRQRLIEKINSNF